MTLDSKAVNEMFNGLWADVLSEEERPRSGLLAHYTSIPTMEAIIKNDELWLSNPLFMNDHEELRFGINEAAQAFRTHKGIKDACGPETRYEALRTAFEEKLYQVSTEHAFDTYVTCFSVHDPVQDKNGRLSMWRGYGGDGHGAALVFDVTKIPEGIKHKSLILARVHYASRDERINWINQKLDAFAAILARSDVPGTLFYAAVHSLLERFKVFALFSKHDGFIEEQEWRLVYLKAWDENRLFWDMLGYFVGPRGVEPKLKLRGDRLANIAEDHFSIISIIEKIILGPSVSSNLAVTSVQRMCETLQCANLGAKIFGSETPYRANVR